MRLYKIADLIVKLNCFSMTENNAKKYSIDSVDDVSDIDILIDTNKTFIVDKSEETKEDAEIVAYLYEGNEFARQLLKFNGVWIHASAVVVDGKAYLFSAPCGTGKSTHTSKWLELFGDKAFIINDDKPAIRIIDGEFFVYGTPWSGKHDISVNTKAKLQGICFLRRDETNWIKPMDLTTAIAEMVNTSNFKATPEQFNKKLDIFDEIIRNIPIWEMGCTPTVEAAKMAYEAMSSKEIK